MTSQGPLRPWETKARVLPGWKTLCAAELKKGFLGSQAWWQRPYQSLMIRALSELERDLTPPEYAFSCNQISEHYNIYQFQMWLMPSSIQPPHFFISQFYSEFPTTHFEHVMAFSLPLTSFDSSGDFSNRLRSRSRKGILLGAGARTVKDKAFPAPKEI